MLIENVEEITLQELLNLYNRVGASGEEGGGPKNPRAMPAMLKKYADRPALELFKEDDEVTSVVRDTAEEFTRSGKQIPKATAQTVRYLSHLLTKGFSRNPPAYLAQKPDDPAETERILGYKEAPKAAAKLSVATDPAKRQAFFDKLSEYEAKNPEKQGVIRAIHFGLNTGLRPAVYVFVKGGGEDESGLFADQYGDNGSIFIAAEGEGGSGAKGSDISIPLNNTADVKVQEQIDYNIRNGLIKEGQANRVFLNPDGSPVTSAQVNEVLGQIKVPRLIYDRKTRTYYDNFMLTPDAKTKKGMSLFRNYHTRVGKNVLGIPLNVLAKIQGRSVKSVKMDAATGSLLEYDEDFPFEVSEYERSMANRYTEDHAVFYDNAIEAVKEAYPDYSFDYGDPDTTLITERITRQTQGMGSYFETPPAVERTPVVKEPQVEIVEQPAPDYSELSPSLQTALKALGDATRRTRQVGKPAEEEQEMQTPSISQAADIFGTALDLMGSGQDIPRVGEVQPGELGEAPTPKSFRNFARKAGRIYRAGRTLYGGYMLKKAIQENLQPSQPGEPSTLYDIGSDLVGGIQKSLQREPSISTPTQPSISPEYDEFSDIQRDLSKSKYNGE